jgi:hypothetical protein
MQKTWWAKGLLGIVSSWSIVACSGDSGKGSDPGSSGPPGRGTAACQSWQGALCDWASKCATATRSVCDSQAKSIICKADDLASSCASKLASASCTAPPAGCDSADLADTAAAAAMCQTYLESACDALLRCNIKSDKSACLMELATMHDCSKVVGVGLGYETCLGDLANGACDKLLPSSCNGAFFATK